MWAAQSSANPMVRRVSGQGLKPSGFTEMWFWSMGRLRGGKAGTVRAVDALGDIDMGVCNGFVGSRYFGFYVRHLGSVSEGVGALIMPYFLYKGLLLLLNYSQ